MSSAPACPSCAPARAACTTRSTPSTANSPTGRSTSSSPTTSKTSSPGCAARPPQRPSPNASASCACSSKTCSSAPTRSPSATASRCGTTRAAGPTTAPKPTRRAKYRLIANCVGGVISPLLCNVYLHRIDRAWKVREHGVLVRFADDALVMCTSREQAEAALTRLRELFAELGLEPKEAKTRIVHLQVDGAGFDFLGFHHRLVRVTSRRNHRRSVTFLARWPADRAMRQLVTGSGN